MNTIEEAIIGYWGERCPDVTPGCPCCDAWIEYDAMNRADPAMNAPSDPYPRPYGRFTQIELADALCRAYALEQAAQARYGGSTLASDQAMLAERTGTMNAICGEIMHRAREAENKIAPAQI